MATLTLLRHGQSQWNLENRFTGWVDVDLTPQGEEEARIAGAQLTTVPIDVVFTSALTRAIRTASIALDAAGKQNVPTYHDQALNERHYGDLQGLNKSETADKYGADMVHTWRRSYDVPPPNGESLKQTQERVAPYYEQQIKPLLQQGKNVMVVAHGNSLRALIMFVENLSPEEILRTEVTTGVPIVYELDNQLRIHRKTILASHTK